MQELIEAVKKHASENYNEHGWDFVVETFSDEEIENIIREDGATTVEQAIQCVGFYANLLDERRRDIRATAW